MITFIILLIIAALWIWGVKCIFSSGHIFEKAGEWVENNLPEWVYKPTIGCPACMSSVHGSIWYWTWGIVFLPEVGLLLRAVIWVIFCICLCGINFILLESIYKDESE
jgi:hypothetical protein